MEENKPLTVPEFALEKNVPVQAIIDAMLAKRIIPIETDQPDMSLCTIHPAYLDTFKIELIGIIEYSDRKGVTRQAVYNRIDKGTLPYYLDLQTNDKKIDWVQHSGLHFRKFGKQNSVSHHIK